MTVKPELRYPALYDSADVSAIAGQQFYMRAIAVRLTALVFAALGGAASTEDKGLQSLAWLALVAFVVALAAEVLIFAVKPDERWYEGRAAAESVKTLTWRYAVAGDPFPEASPNKDVDKTFLSRLSEVTRDLQSIILAVTPSAKCQITSEMRTVRGLPFEAKRDTYVAGRIDDQIDWYAGKSRRYHQCHTVFLLLTIGLEFVGVVVAVLRVTELVRFDLLGILAALVAGVASWSQTRQYGSLARAYGIATQELVTIRSEAASIEESEWARFVDDAEQAISREHTLWRASRGVLARGP